MLNSTYHGLKICCLPIATSIPWYTLYVRRQLSSRHFVPGQADF